MENNLLEVEKLNEESIISSDELLNHWQGHRNLTRKMIEAFPEKEFFTFSIGGMRPFSELIMEMIDITSAGVNGIVTGQWKTIEDLDHVSGNNKLQTKKDYLERWDNLTEELNIHWKKIPAKRFHEVEAAFGQFEDTIFSTALYFIDNEIHHRGQGYVYLRALGITPPPFWER